MIINKLKKEITSKDYIFKELIIQNKKINLIFNEVLTDSNSINKLLYYLLTKVNKKDLNNLINKIPISNSIIIKEKDIKKYLNLGYVIIIYKNIYAVELKSHEGRGVQTINSELSIGGAKDSFSENINTNLSLIRKRIKRNLIVETLAIGRISQTKVNILGINGIVSNKLIKSVKKRLEKIDIDGIMDSSYLKFSLEDGKNLFPTIMMSERPDKCSMALLEGKIVILVENSCYGLILPSFLLDFFHTTDDYFQKSFNTTFIRIIRLFAFLIAVFLPALYISVTTRNYELVPFPLLLMLKAGRSFVPFPAYIEALFMIIAFEILKESDLRMSTTSGSAVSILGGLILGDAAVSAGIVSPIMIIIIAISSIAGLIFTSIELVNALRIYKIFLLILGTILGIYGVIFGGVIMFINIFKTKIFGFKYLEIDKNEIKDSIIKIDDNIRKRNTRLTNNVLRGRYKWKST
mgnify:FL=1